MLQIDAIPRPKALLRTGRLDTTYPKTKKKTIPGHSSCVPAVPNLHQSVFCAPKPLVAQWRRVVFLCVLFRPRISCRLSGRAYSADRLCSIGGPFHGVDRRLVGCRQSAFVSRSSVRLDQYVWHTAAHRDAPGNVHYRNEGWPLTFNSSASHQITNNVRK